MKHHFYIFGGTFDPPHQGHVGVIKELEGKTVVVAPTFANPFKEKSESSFVKRVEMLKKVLDYEKIDYQDLDEGVEKQVLISAFERILSLIKEASKRLIGSFAWSAFISASSLYFAWLSEIEWLCRRTT